MTTKRDLFVTGFTAESFTELHYLCDDMGGCGLGGKGHVTPYHGDCVATKAATQATTILKAALENAVRVGMRKPFETLEGQFQEAGCGPWTVLLSTANAAIAQDAEHHLKLMEISKAILLSERQERANITEVEALRAEVTAYKEAKAENDERFQLEAGELRVQLAEAERVMAEVRSVANYCADKGNEMRSNWCVEQFGYIAEQARAYLEKYKKS